MKTNKRKALMGKAVINVRNIQKFPTIFFALLFIYPLYSQTNVIVGGTTPATVASPTSGSSISQQLAKLTVIDGDASVNKVTLGRGGGQDTSNTAVGNQALYYNLTTGVQNTSVGFWALRNNTSGAYNTALGSFTMRNNTTGQQNTALGRYAMISNVSGGNNTSVGLNSLFFNTIGSDNTAIGLSALQNTNSGNRNTALGVNALDNNTSGSNNIAIGYNADVPSATASNQLSIGNVIYGTGVTSTIGAGNIGIGTSAPTEKLHVAGNSLTTGNAEVQGQLKLGTVNQNNAGTDVLVRNADGMVAKRDASSIGGVPSSGIVLSEVENNTTLLINGFSLIGYNSTLFTPVNINLGPWTAYSITNIPSPRYGHSAVWSGSEMIIWGGNIDGSNGTIEGGKYNPANDTWSGISTINDPFVRDDHSTIWTGSEMIVWGGSVGAVYFNTGGRYNPSSDTWDTINTINAPTARQDHTAVWTGSEMIIWGGYNQHLGGLTNTGSKYNPSTNTWTTISTTNAPIARNYHTAIWTGTEMIIWGGYNSGYLSTGGKYNPSTDTWTSISLTNVPIARTNHSAIWTGTEMIIWGGNNGSSSFNVGDKYNPANDLWTTMSTTNVPAARSQHTTVWTGSKMIIWGGYGTSYLNSGGIYDPVANTWTNLSISNAPLGRVGHRAVWTGSKMIIGFGLNGGPPLNSGAKTGDYFGSSSTVNQYLYKKS